jgi:hypothetical protein
MVGWLLRLDPLLNQSLSNRFPAKVISSCVMAALNGPYLLASWRRSELGGCMGLGRGQWRRPQHDSAAAIPSKLMLAQNSPSRASG